MTGIRIEYDKDLLSNTKPTVTGKASKSNEKMLYFTIKELKSQKGAKKVNMEQICKVLGEKQKNGELTHHIDFSEAKPNTVAHLFYRLQKDFENEINED